MTNRNWVFTADELRAETGMTCLWLVNDFVAAAAGIGALTDNETSQIGGQRGDAGPKVILGPGTGLGAAAIVSEDDGRERVIASEAGHMGAAAGGELAEAVCERLRAHHGRSRGSGCCAGLAVRRRRAASGSRRRLPMSPHGPRGDVVTLRAAAAFAHALGEFAGDVCLALRATGGVYLVGGVLQGLGRAFDAVALRAGFEDKGRFGTMLRGLPCFLVQADDVAARGLARLLRAVRARFPNEGDETTPIRS
jgi:glucokinase